MGKQKEEVSFEPLYCMNCKVFLFEEAIFMGAVRIKCHKCNTIIVFERTPDFGDDEARVKVKRPKRKRGEKK